MTFLYEFVCYKRHLNIRKMSKVPKMFEVRMLSNAMQTSSHPYIRGFANYAPYIFTIDTDTGSDTWKMAAESVCVKRLCVFDSIKSRWRTHLGGVGFYAVSCNKIVDCTWNVRHGQRVQSNEPRYLLHEGLWRTEPEINNIDDVGNVLHTGPLRQDIMYRTITGLG